MNVKHGGVIYGQVSGDSVFFCSTSLKAALGCPRTLRRDLFIRGGGLWSSWLLMNLHWWPGLPSTWSWMWSRSNPHRYWEISKRKKKEEKREKGKLSWFELILSCIYLGEMYSVFIQWMTDRPKPSLCRLKCPVNFIKSLFSASNASMIIMVWCLAVSYEGD